MKISQPIYRRDDAYDPVRMGVHSVPFPEERRDYGAEQHAQGGVEGETVPRGRVG